MKDCYILNTRTNGLEVFQIGEEEKVLNRIKEIDPLFPSRYGEKQKASRFMDRDHSMFESTGLRATNLSGIPVYIGKIA